MNEPRNWEFFQVRGRAAVEASEEATLAPWGTRSSEGHRSGAPDEPDGLRPQFQRDRDRVLHARAFRRLKHKTQVFVPHTADHPRTRLTHTLEVAQIGRTIGRALAVNEDLVEAIALGHDLGHTAFGHTGETVLKEILAGAGPDVILPEAVVETVGTFKHNYQSLRVVDLLERRYAHPGLGLTDQVREGILKHTGWRPDMAFPLPNVEGLNLDGPCHIEGQVVAVADEIAQQTHDLEDGLRLGSVTLEAVLDQPAAQRVMAHLGSAWTDEPRRWRRQNLLIRGLIALFVGDVIQTTVERLRSLIRKRNVGDRAAFRAIQGEISPTLVWFSPAIDEIFSELKRFIYQFIINHAQVNRQDWRARKVMTALFRAFWSNPLTLPSYVLLRANEELGVPYLRDVPLPAVAAEIAARYHPSAGFARLVTDHLAGMSDRFALEEYRSLEQPTPDQRFPGDIR